MMRVVMACCVTSSNSNKARRENIKKNPKYNATGTPLRHPVRRAYGSSAYDDTYIGNPNTTCYREKEPSRVDQEILDAFQASFRPSVDNNSDAPGFYEMTAELREAEFGMLKKTKSKGLIKRMKEHLKGPAGSR